MELATSLISALNKYMSLGEVWEICGAVIVSIGGGATLVFLCSSWLGKLWAARILEDERAKYAQELERLRSKLNMSLKGFEIRTAGVFSDQKQRILAIQRAISDAQLAAFELVYFAMSIEPGMQVDFSESRRVEREASRALAQQIAEARLFLQADLFALLEDFHRQLHALCLISSAERNVWESRQNDPDRVKESRRILQEQFDQLKTFNAKLDPIWSRFREILGTEIPHA